MKKFASRCVAGLCVAAGSLAAVAPAHAAYVTSVLCTDSIVTNYVACVGPQEGFLQGTQGERTALTNAFKNIVGTDPFIYLGKSSDSNGGPFLANPASPVGVLTFDVPLFGPFVLGFESDSNDNYSYYLFNAGSVGTTIVPFDTLGITGKDGSPAGPNLGFAGLYVQQQPQAVVPEPGSIALLGAAFGGLVLTTRRRRG